MHDLVCVIMHYDDFSPTAHTGRPFLLQAGIEWHPASTVWRTAKTRRLADRFSATVGAFVVSCGVGTRRITIVECQLFPRLNRPLGLSISMRRVTKMQGCDAQRWLLG